MGRAHLRAAVGVAAVLAVLAVMQRPRVGSEPAVRAVAGDALLVKLRQLLRAKKSGMRAAEAPRESTGAEEARARTHAELAAAALHWKRARTDWQPYNPSLSLTQNKLARQAEGDERETEKNEREIVDRLAVPRSRQQSTHDRRAQARVRLERYQANMYLQKPTKACADWAAHPVDCIRAAYGNHLRGTKFAKLRRRYDGHVTEDSLDRERNLISKKVSEGLIKGSIKAPKHDKAVTSWLHRVKAEMRAARKAAMQRALTTRLQQQERDADEGRIAREWSSGIAASGPDAGRRYYVDNRSGKTSFSAPQYVKRALRDVRMRKKAVAQRAVAHEAQMYEEGFRAAQHALLVHGGSMSVSHLTPPTASPVENTQLDRIHAARAIRTFLKRSGRKLTRQAYSGEDLARERARIAHKLGFKSLMHQRGRLPQVRRQQRVSMQREGSNADGLVGGLTRRRGATDQAGALSRDSSRFDNDPPQVALAKAVKEEDSAVKQRMNELQSEVRAQNAIIQDLEQKVAQATPARHGATESLRSQGTPTSRRQDLEGVRDRATDGGNRLRTAKDFAALRHQVARDVMRVAREARRVGAFGVMPRAVEPKPGSSDQPWRPAAHLARAGVLGRMSLAAGSAPLSQRQLQAITDRTMHRMRQSAAGGAEMI